MKNMIKILFAVMLAAALVFSFGCGAGDLTPADTTEADTTMTEETTASDTTAAETEPAETEPVKPDPPETEFSKMLLVSSFEKATFTASNGVELQYCIYVPENYSEAYAYPTLLFLHGAGVRSLKNGDQLSEGVQTWFVPKGRPVYNSIAVFPLCPPDEQWVDTPWAQGSYSTDEVAISDNLAAVIELMDYIAETYSTNPNRQYISGLSMGGYGTWDLIARYPDRFAAALPLCGAGDPSRAEELKDLPIWTFHDLDDESVPVTGSQDMVNAIKAAGGEMIKYDESQGLGHSIWDPVYGKTEVQEWLFSQVKE